MPQVGVFDNNQVDFGLSPTLTDVNITNSLTGIVRINVAPHVHSTSVGAYAAADGDAGVFVGFWAGPSNTGDNNTFIGYATGLNNGTGAANVLIGSTAGLANTTGTGNVFIGYQAGVANTTVGSNTFIGYQAGATQINPIGSNCFIGAQSGNKNTTGYYNCFVGTNTGVANTTGYENTFIGEQAGYRHTEGHDNVFLGQYTGGLVTTGVGNTLIGQQSGGWNLTGITTGSGNTYLGMATGQSGNGDYGVFIGYETGYFETGSNKLFIDNARRGNEADARVKAMVYGVFAAATANQYFCHNSNVGIGTISFGANSDFVFAIKNGTPPAGHVDDEIQVYSKDASTGGATLGIETEAAVEAIGTFTASNKLKIWVNGTEYWIQLDAV